MYAYRYRGGALLRVDLLVFSAAAPDCHSDSPQGSDAESLRLTVSDGFECSDESHDKGHLEN